MARLPVMMDDNMFDVISNRIYESYPNACILFIDSVSNSDLLHNYNQQRECIHELRGEVKELQLFHGTDHYLIDIIAKEGFDPTKNKTAAYGYGTYFAKNAGYSQNYMRGNPNDITYMFLADVLIGTLTTGMRRITTEKYQFDNNVDSKINPTIYTTPYRYGAYPKYIIAFHKNQK
jgi:hypothetical protein